MSDNLLVFVSRVDGFFYGMLVFVAFILCFVGFMLHKQIQRRKATGALVILLPGAVLALGLPLWLLFSTRYTVSETTLQIRSGPMSWTIDRNEIHSITPTRSALSSPALSLDRLEIRYGDTGMVMVSPKDKEGFLAALGMTAE